MLQNTTTTSAGSAKDNANEKNVGTATVVMEVVFPALFVIIVASVVMHYGSAGGGSKVGVEPFVGAAPIPMAAMNFEAWESSESSVGTMNYTYSPDVSEKRLLYDSIFFRSSNGASSRDVSGIPPVGDSADDMPLNSDQTDSVPEGNVNAATGKKVILTESVFV